MMSLATPFRQDLHQGEQVIGEPRGGDAV